MAPLIETVGRLSPPLPPVSLALARLAGVGGLLDHRDAAEVLAVGDQRGRLAAHVEQRTPWRGRPTSVLGADELERQVAGDRGQAADLAMVAELGPRRLAPGVQRAGRLGRPGARDLDDLGAGRRREREHRRRHRSVGDVGRLQLEHRGRVVAGVDGEPQRHALDRVPGELGLAEQAAVVLGRDADRVGGLAGDVGRRARPERLTCWPTAC